MASKQNHGDNHGSSGNAARRAAPEWADGLKQLYDSVVEEDLPDSFKDLLDRLDGDDSANAQGGTDGDTPSPAGRDKRS